MVWVRYNETLANNTEGSTADIPASTAAWLAERGFVSFSEPAEEAAVDAPEKPAEAPKKVAQPQTRRGPGRPRKVV